MVLPFLKIVTVSSEKISVSTMAPPHWHPHDYIHTQQNTHYPSSNYHPLPRSSVHNFVSHISWHVWTRLLSSSFSMPSHFFTICPFSLPIILFLDLPSSFFAVLSSFYTIPSSFFTVLFVVFTVLSSWDVGRVPRIYRIYFPTAPIFLLLYTPYLRWV